MPKAILTKVTIAMIFLGLTLAVPAVAQTGIAYLVEYATNLNTKNATNPDAQVPPTA
jgi:hypothetical protein